MTTPTHHNLKEYYGKVLSHSDDLQTNACCSDTKTMPPSIRRILSDIHEDVLARFYGCGSPIPALLEGMTVLDLGCGTGRDAYILSSLVGPSGHVIGVDMTEEQLAVAHRTEDYHREIFGYKQANTDFYLGFIEDLQSIGIEDASVDVVVSNCVINLSPEKEAVFSEIFRVLKPGGELYFSDVFSSSRIPESLRDDPMLHGECLSGAMYTEDFRRMLAGFGCLDVRQISKAPITIDNPELESRIGMTTFYSQTMRAFKIAALEDRCEDYGQVAVYKGSITEHPHHFDLDDHHRFFAHKPMLVCGNTASMLQHTRFAPHFNISGNRGRHFGLFDCTPELVAAVSAEPNCC